MLRRKMPAGGNTDDGGDVPILRKSVVKAFGSDTFAVEAGIISISSIVI